MPQPVAYQNFRRRIWTFLETTIKFMRLLAGIGPDVVYHSKTSVSSKWTPSVGFNLHVSSCFIRICILSRSIPLLLSHAIFSWQHFVGIKSSGGPTGGATGLIKASKRLRSIASIFILLCMAPIPQAQNSAALAVCHGESFAQAKSFAHTWVDRMVFWAGWWVTLPPFLPERSNVARPKQGRIAAKRCHCS